MTPHEAHQMSVILGVPLNEIMRQAGIDVVEDVRRSVIAAYVDDTGRVITMPPGTHDTVLGPADCPVGTYAIQVRAPASTRDGWLLFVTPTQLPSAENVDQLCLAALADGKQCLAVVRRGYRRDTNNLIMWPSNEVVADATVVWTSGVLWIKPSH